MTDVELNAARALLAAKLSGVSAALPGKVSMTAISRPVSRGVFPAVERLVPGAVGADSLSLSAVSSSIARIAGLSMEQTQALTGDTGSTLELGTPRRLGNCREHRRRIIASS